jgi:hypothetical protein
VTPTAAVHAVLSADATLVALLPGGVWSGLPEITRQLAPGAFDANGELQTCALVKSDGERDAGPRRIAGAQLVNVWVYDRASDGRVEEVLTRVHELLHRRPLGNQMWEASRFAATWGWREEALSARGGVGRYEVHVYRG